MAIYTYSDMHYVLRKPGFELIRGRKHETWERILEDGTVLQVRTSHKGKRDIPPGTFYEMLRQAGIDKNIFLKVLRE
jgi:predicted RNA binding protein YcfA (HicA-like mRNA interferase family)